MYQLSPLSEQIARRADSHNRIINTRTYREQMLADPHRPTWHFAIPDDNGIPGDTNGAFFADGRYHLMYLYRNSATNGFHWGHISSIDLLHWRHHPDAIGVEADDDGCNSGGAFVDDDGTAYLTFWKFVSRSGRDHGGIAMACARPPYNVWERMKPIAIEGDKPWGVKDLEVDGKIEHIGCADPSNIWKYNGMYYMQTGNLCVLSKYGRAEDADPHYRGDWVDLFRSKDLKTWEYVHRFYENPYRVNAVNENDWPDRSEDDMCPSFLPLFDRSGNPTGKWLQLFISHNKGTQYYIGTLSEDGETFMPEKHERFSWNDSACFAPEALIDDKNRQIVWCWMRDDRLNEISRFGWSGVYAFPRQVWLEDGELHMAPVEELARLQYNAQSLGTAAAGEIVPVKNGESFRMTAVIEPGEAKKVGFSVRGSADGAEKTLIYADLERGKLVFDATQSGAQGRKIVEEAPFELNAGEALTLDILVDKSVVEVYANDRQAIARRIYPTNPEESLTVRALDTNAGAVVTALDVWEMSPANLY